MPKINEIIEKIKANPAPWLIGAGVIVVAFLALRNRGASGSSAGGLSQGLGGSLGGVPQGLPGETQNGTTAASLADTVKTQLDYLKGVSTIKQGDIAFTTQDKYQQGLNSIDLTGKGFDESQREKTSAFDWLYRPLDAIKGMVSTQQFVNNNTFNGGFTIQGGQGATPVDQLAGNSRFDIMNSAQNSALAQQYQTQANGIKSLVAASQPQPQKSSCKSFLGFGCGWQGFADTWNGVAKNAITTATGGAVKFNSPNSNTGYPNFPIQITPTFPRNSGYSNPTQGGYRLDPFGGYADTAYDTFDPNLIFA